MSDAPATDETPAPPPAPAAAPRPAHREWRHLRVRLARAWRGARQRWQAHGPQALAALLAAGIGALQLHAQIAPLLAAWQHFEQHGAAALLQVATLLALPRVLLGLGLILMAFALLTRARIAWVITLLLALFSAGLALWQTHSANLVFIGGAALILLLLFYARHFRRSSLAASSIFALLGIGSLLAYGVLGSLWFGAGFDPPIRDLSAAFYFSIVTMSTVGYGDIVPHSVEARMFTISLIVLGITVFATTLSVVIGPLVGGSIKRVLEGRMQKSQRQNHYVIIGMSSLALTLWQQLRLRNVPVTVIVTPGRPLPYPEDADRVEGDPTRDSVLQEAGVAQAKAVFALREDDAENAFVVLAVKELAPGVRTIAAVNDAQHLNKIRRVQPDVLFAPQVLGSDLLVRRLFDEPIDEGTVDKLLFQ
jgi:voltage-gated potassium channel